MTSRPSTTVTGPCAALMTRSGRYSCCCFRSSISASMKASGFGRAAVVIGRSPGSLPAHDHLAGIARAGGGEGGLEVAEREAVRDDRPDVDARVHQHAHLVPALVH